MLNYIKIYKKNKHDHILGISGLIISCPMAYLSIYKLSIAMFTGGVYINI